jgi:prepilin-type N-terminal cleavage/methylation domain-containing protein
MRVIKPLDARSAFTQIELLATIAIVCILAATGLVAWQPLIAHAEGVKCLSHMRSLHASLVSYVQDVGHWPQEPDSDDENVDIDADWWIRELAPDSALADRIRRNARARAEHLLPGRIHQATR